MVIMFKDRTARALSLVSGLSWMLTIIFLLGQAKSFFSFVAPMARWWCNFSSYCQSDTTAFLAYLHIHTQKLLIVTSLALSLFTLCYILLVRFSDVEKYDASELTRPKVCSWELGLLFLFVVLGAILRLRGMTRGFTYDELFTTVHFVETKSFWQTISSYLVFNNHLFYSVAARFSWLLIGRGEWVVRLPSFLAGLLAIPIFWCFLREWVDEQSALLATFFLAIHPMHIVMSRSARGYSFLALGTLVTSWLFFRLLENGRASLCPYYVLSISLMVWGHLYGVIVVLCQALALLWYLWQWQTPRNNLRFIWLSIGLSGVVTILLYLPVLPLLLLELGREKSGVFDSAFMFNVLTQFLWTPSAAVLALVLIFFLWTIYDQRKEKTTFLHLLYLCAPLLMAWALKMRAVGFARFALFALPSFLWFISLGVSRLAARLCKERRYIFPLILVLLVAPYWVSKGWFELDCSGFRQALAAVPKDVALCALGGDAYLFAYYGHGRMTVPKNEADFYKILKREKVLYCIFHDVSWASAFHRRLYSRYGKSAQPFGDVYFFKVSP